MYIRVYDQQSKKFPVLMESNSKAILMVYRETQFHYEGHLMVDNEGVHFCPHRSCHEYRSDWKKEDFKFFEGEIILSN